MNKAVIICLIGMLAVSFTSARDISDNSATGSTTTSRKLLQEIDWCNGQVGMTKFHCGIPFGCRAPDCVHAGGESWQQCSFMVPYGFGHCAPMAFCDHLCKVAPSVGHKSSCNTTEDTYGKWNLIMLDKYEDKYQFGSISCDPDGQTK